MKKAPDHDTYDTATPKDIPVEKCRTYRVPVGDGTHAFLQVKRMTGNILTMVDLQTQKNYRMSKSTLERKLEDGTISVLT